MQQITLPQMASLLMQIGVLIPFQKKTPTGEVMRMPEVGPMGGRVVPFARGPAKPTNQQMYNDALRKQKGEPQTQRGGPWPIGPRPDIPKHWDIHHVERMKAEKIKKYLEERAKAGLPLDFP